jgi:hypothetical protein
MDRLKATTCNSGSIRAGVDCPFGALQQEAGRLDQSGHQNGNCSSMQQGGLKVFASEDAVEKWFTEHDPEGVAFVYEVIE